MLVPGWVYANLFLSMLLYSVTTLDGQVLTFVLCYNLISPACPEGVYIFISQFIVTELDHVCVCVCVCVISDRMVKCQWTYCIV